MSMTDPIADLLTRIRNAQLANHDSTAVPASKLKLRIVDILKAEGYIATIKNGKVTFRDGEWTGETPGGLIRGPQRVELLEAAE